MSQSAKMKITLLQSRKVSNNLTSNSRIFKHILGKVMYFTFSKYHPFVFCIPTEWVLINAEFETIIGWCRVENSWPSPR